LRNGGSGNSPPALGNAADIGLVLSGLPLMNPTVGLGVYTIRLIRGLIRNPSSPPFRVLVPASFRDTLSGIPDSILIPFCDRRMLPHPLPRQVILSRRLVSMAIKHFPGAIFHSPGPFWSIGRPARTVITLHDCIYRHFPLYEGRFWVRRWLNRAAERYAASASAVLTVSQFSAKDLTRTTGIPASKIRVIYNWLGPEYEAVDRMGPGPARIRDAFGLPERFWLYVGGYDYRKNVDRLIEAYAAASGLTSCPPLVLAGQIPSSTKPPYSDVMAKIQATGLASRIRTVGSIDESHLPSLYAAAELFVYPSLYEGFGLPAAEAIAAGTPVLVSDSTSLMEVVPRLECRFDPRSIAAIAQKLTAAATDANQFRCHRRQEFFERHAIDRYLELLAQIA
jgi:glycosyltransferase involved in cell wall biosynthesis